MTQKRKKLETIILVAGLLLVFVGIFGNEWTLARIFGPLSREVRTLTYVFDIFVILCGILLIKFRSHPKLPDALFGIIFTVILLVGIEAAFRFLNRAAAQNISREGGFTGDFIRYDETLGYKPQPGVQVSSIYRKDGKVAYDVTYTTDEYSRRVTPEEHPGDKSKFILFFGGSFVLGEGVEDDETLPFYVSQLAPQYRAYNYGFSGYGPQQMLAHLQRNDITEEVQGESGMLVYLFMDAHVSRAIGSMYVYNGWGEDMPFYTLNTDGELVRKGSFRSGRPVLSTIYFVMDKIQTLQFLKVDFPRIGEAQLELTARILEKSRDTFTERFGSEDFYVLFYPGSQYTEALVPYLEDAGIRYLDYSDLIDPDRPEFRIEGEGHPNPNAYRTIAEQFARDVGVLDPDVQH